MADNLDISTKESRKAITLDNLIEYCVDTKNIEALKWLRDADAERVEKTLPNGKKVMAKRNINLIKNDFFKKFCGYKTNSQINADEKRRQKKEEEQNRINKLFEEAFDKIQ